MKHLELKVATLVVVSLGLLAMFIAILGGFSFGPVSRLYVDYDFSGNIHEGAPVKISGIKVGKVEQIAFHGGEVDPDVKRRIQVRLTVQIEERARKAIHAAVASSASHRISASDRPLRAGAWNE